MKIEEDDNRRVIVTGATSSIGIALIRLLTRYNFSIIALIRPHSKRKNIINQYDNVTIYEYELGEYCHNNIQYICGKCKFLFHLGWSSDFEHARYNMNGQMNNIIYTLDAIHLAANCECEAFIGVGSQAECGIIDYNISEGTPDNPLTAYAYAKCEAFRQGKIECEINGIRYCWPRLLSAYGIYDRNHTLIMSCIEASRQKTTIPLTPCEQIWDYIYVDDVAEALFAIAQNGLHAVKYPIASGKGQMLSDYIRSIAMITSNPFLMNGIGARPYAKNQPMYLVGDIERLTRDTGFIPKVKFEDGIKMILQVL